MSQTDINNSGDLEDGVGPWMLDQSPSVAVLQSVPRRPLTFNPEDWAPARPIQIINTWDDFDDDEDGSIMSPVPQRSRIPISQTLLAAGRAPQQDAVDTISSNIREEIAGLEGTQNALLEQIRDLEIAHLQLEGARNELLRVLETLEQSRDEDLARTQLDIAHRRIIERFERQALSQGLVDESAPVDLEDDSFDFYEEVLSNQLRALDTIPRMFPIVGDGSTGEAHFMDMFLDGNGDPCVGFEDCLFRAVGWNSGEKSDQQFQEYGLDRNGEEADEDDKSSSNGGVSLELLR